MSKDTSTPLENKVAKMRMKSKTGNAIGAGAGLGVAGGGAKTEEDFYEPHAPRITVNFS